MFLILHVSLITILFDQDAYNNVLQALESYDVCHPRPTGLTVANNLGAGLSIPYRSINKNHAPPTRDYGI